MESGIAHEREATVEVDRLRKAYGNTVALDGMTFTARPGAVTGLVGPDGAGKSTTLRMVLGLDLPDSGTALVGGRPYRALPRPLCYVGAVLAGASPQPGQSARNHLLWLAHSQGLGAGRVDEVLAVAGLGAVARRRAGGLSRGLRHRLGIAAALLGDPPVLVLDEPFRGLDPEGVAWMRRLLTELAGQGRAVLVTSHLMSELQDTVDHLIVIRHGRVIRDVEVPALLAAASSGRVRLRTPERDRAIVTLTHAGATVATAGADVLTVHGLSTERMVELLGRDGVPLAEVSAHRAGLEEAYLELTRAGSGGATP